MARLLIVDDEEKLVTILKEFLTGQGIEVWTAKTGNEALQLVEQHKPQVLLLDLNLEGSPVSGLEVLTKTKALLPRAVVLVVSGYSDDEKKSEALRHGADDYLEKPLRLPDVLKAIRSALTKASPS